jgi:hypothetical protein
MFMPDPKFFHPGSRICIKEFKYFNPKKWFLSSRKYDPGSSSRIPDIGIKKATDTGSLLYTVRYIQLQRNSPLAEEQL